MLCYDPLGLQLKLVLPVAIVQHPFLSLYFMYTSFYTNITWFHATILSSRGHQVLAYTLFSPDSKYRCRHVHSCQCMVERIILSCHIFLATFFALVFLTQSFLEVDAFIEFLISYPFRDTKEKRIMKRWYIISFLIQCLPKTNLKIAESLFSSKLLKKNANDEKSSK